ncbi:MAG: NAD(P)-dependent oxidoreductase [Cyclobacteriaceae bacterium]|nr:NAD(P)-dependent oxidoreductase [Cyclobacteriaceae bacterium]
MKILLTGGSGFIGKNIKESFLNEKYKIYAPTRTDLDCANDKSVDQYFSKNSFDVVIHSAAKPGHRNAADPNNILYPNSRMTLNLLKHRDSWGKLLNMGSGAIYDMNHYQPKMKEEYFGTHIPTDQHGYNKYICGLLFPFYKNTIDFRIFGIFGKHEDYSIRFISNAICKSLYDLPITLRQNKKFDYLCVDDLMPILDYFIVNDAKHSEYNITPNGSIPLLTLAEMVKQVSGNKNEIIVHEVGLGLEYSGDNSRLKREYKQVSFTSIEVAIEKLYVWYKSNIGSIDKKLLLIDK